MVMIISTWFFIILVIFCGLFFIGAFVVPVPKIDEFLGIMFLYTFFILLLLGLFNVLNNTPKAIDVYRGKTTLEITYRDSIPVDSLVVYKK